MRNKDEEIRLTNVPQDLKSDLKNIAANTGMTLTQMLKPVLRQVRDSYPEDMRKKRDY